MDESHFEVAEILLKNEAKIDAGDVRGKTPFYYLLKNGNMKIIKLFLSYYASVKAEIEGDVDLLLETVKSNKNPDVIQLLIDNGSTVNIVWGDKNDEDVAGPMYFGRYLENCFKQSWKGKTPLHLAMINDDNSKVAEVLIKNGASLNIKDEFGQTPLHYLVMNSSAETIKLCLTFNFDVNVVNKEEENLLFSAANSNKNVEVLQLLIDLGLDVNHRNRSGQTALNRVFASENKKIEKIKCLLKNGANISTTDRFMILFQLSGNILNFVIKHTDFNEIFIDKSYVSRFISDSFYRSSWKVILRHLAKLQALNITNPDLVNFFYRWDECKYYYEQCKEELSQAKNTRLKNSWVSLCNLLIDERKQLKNYCGNSELIEDFEGSDCEKNFPIYGFEINKNMRKGINRRELFEKSCVLLSECLPIFNPTHLIIKDTFDCVLSRKDLSKFCE